MVSPYINGTQGSAGYTPDLSRLLEAGNQATQQGFATVGKLGGALGSGIVGAVQGGQSPQVFGPDTSSASGAAQGGMMNFANVWNGGQGGGQGGADMNGFARLVRGGQGGQSGGMNFKQFAAAGKAADGLFDFLKEKQRAEPDEAVYGVTPNQHDHMSTADKLAWANSVQDKQTAQAAMQGYDMGQQHMLQARQQMEAQRQQMDERAQQMDATQQDRAAWQRYAQAASAATAAPDLGDTSQLPAPLQDFAAAARGLGGPPISGQDMNRMALAAGVNPKDALAISQGQRSLDIGEMELARQQRYLNQQDATPTTTTLPSGTQMIYDPKTGAMQVDPTYKSMLRPQLTATARPARDTYGNPSTTGEMEMQVTGHPDDVSTWVALSKVPKDNIAWSKAHPESAASFDKHYGNGLSAKVLGR